MSSGRLWEVPCTLQHMLITHPLTGPCKLPSGRLPGELPAWAGDQLRLWSHTAVGAKPAFAAQLHVKPVRTCLTSPGLSFLVQEEEVMRTLPV